MKLNRRERQIVNDLVDYLADEIMIKRAKKDYEKWRMHEIIKLGYDWMDYPSVEKAVHKFSEEISGEKKVRENLCKEINLSSAQMQEELRKRDAVNKFKSSMEKQKDIETKLKEAEYYQEKLTR